MSYNGTQARTGFGSTLSINTGTDSSPTWTAVGEVSAASQAGTENLLDDVTNLQSTAVERIPTLLEPGTIDFEMNYITGDTGQTALVTSFNGKTLVKYKLELGKTASQVTSGDNFVFRALVKTLPLQVDPKKAIKYKCTLQISGGITFAAGA